MTKRKHNMIGNISDVNVYSDTMDNIIYEVVYTTDPMYKVPDDIKLKFEQLKSEKQFYCHRLDDFVKIDYVGYYLTYSIENAIEKIVHFMFNVHLLRNKDVEQDKIKLIILCEDIIEYVSNVI
jgi:hypothetical protein